MRTTGIGRDGGRVQQGEPAEEGDKEWEVAGAAGQGFISAMTAWTG
jgi:hypothetical protein